MTIIIAGDVRQAHRFVSEHNFKRGDWTFAENPNDIAGFYEVEIVFTGSYWENKLYGSNELQVLLGRHR